MAPSKALEAIWKLVREANRYVDINQPWALAKDPSKSYELAHVFHNLANAIGVIGGLVTPVLPTTGKLLRQWVGLSGAAETAWPTEHDMFKVVGAVAKDPKPMYPRLDDKMQDKILKELVPGDLQGAAAQSPPEPAMKGQPAAPGGDAAPGVITYDDFAKLDLRVGKVLSAVAVPKKDKLLHLQVDLGEGKPRSIIAGLALSYKPEALVGKNVIVVANLAPRKMAGLVSEGMILASGDGDSELGVSALDRDAAPGTRVR
jgi:methionyl-tRNA synthetase